MNEQIEAFMNIFSDEETASFACYPNPFTNEIHISIAADAFGANEIAIYDMIGRKVFVQAVSFYEGSNEITIHPNLSAGIFLLKVGEHVQRIVRY